MKINGSTYDLSVCVCAIITHLDLATGLAGVVRLHLTDRPLEMLSANMNGNNSFRSHYSF